MLGSAQDDRIESVVAKETPEDRNQVRPYRASLPTLVNPGGSSLGMWTGRVQSNSSV